jgi:hypothetical protein
MINFCASAALINASLSVDMIDPHVCYIVMIHVSVSVAMHGQAMIHFCVSVAMIHASVSVVMTHVSVSVAMIYF